MIGRLKEGVTVEQADGVLQAAFTNFRREDVVNNFGRTPLPARRAVRRDSAVRPFGRDRRVAAPRQVPAAAVDSHRDRGADAAHRRVERRQSVPRRTAAREREMSLRSHWVRAEAA